MNSGWQQTTLGEAVTFKGGGTPSTDQAAYWNGDIPWVSPKDMKSWKVGDSIDKITAEAIENSSASLIPADSILIVVRSGILARTIPIAITTRALAVNQDIKALCPNEGVDPRFLQYFMQKSEPDILRLVTRGATVHRLSTDALKALPFPNPSLPEQQRIVAILDEAFAGLATATANAEKNLKNAHELFASALNSAFVSATNEGVQKKVVEVCRLINGRAYSKKELLAKGRYLVLRVGNFFTNKNWYYSDLELEPDKYCNADDLLYAWSASFGPKIWDGDKVIFHYHIWKVEPKVDLIRKMFLFYFFEWDKEKIRREQGAGTTMIHVSKESMERRLVPVPSLQGQDRLIGLLADISSEAKRLAETYEKKLTALSHLKHSILQKAFSGEMTSPPSQAIREAAE